MTLPEAAAKMRRGESIRRTSWKSGAYITTHGGSTFWHQGAVTRYWSPTLDDLIATDWEVIDESTLPIE